MQARAASQSRCSMAERGGGGSGCWPGRTIRSARRAVSLWVMAISLVPRPVTDFDLRQTTNFVTCRSNTRHGFRGPTPGGRTEGEQLMSSIEDIIGRSDAND